MERVWTVTFAAGVLAAILGAPALAAAPGRSTGIEDPARVGRPGESKEGTPQVGGTASSRRELSGTFVKAEGKTLYLEHMGAIVPLRIDERTQFSGGLKSSRDLTEGQAVRASFTVEGETTNVAERISPAPAAGQAPASRGPEGRSPGGGERSPPRESPAPQERVPGLPPDRQPIPGDPGTPVPKDPGPSPVPKY